MDTNKFTSDFNLNRVFRSYTNPYVTLSECGLKNADTSKKRKMRKEIARQLTKMNMEKKKKK
jgi:hypothetical protein